MLLAALILVVSLAAAAGDESEGYLQVTGPCELEFPRDHGAHPGHRTEWWYYTGNLESEDGQPYGFQLTLFRSQLAPGTVTAQTAGQSSAWRTNQVYFGHLAISDIDAGRHWQAENIARGALGLAGAAYDGHVTHIFLHDWSIRIQAGSHQLVARTPDFSIELTAKPIKPLVLHGNKGYTKRGTSAGRASCYYSFTRLNTVGTLTIDQRVIPVRGQSWMDHEFSTAQLEPGIIGWDWFSLQISNRSDIMFFLLRTDSGDIHPASSGTFVDASGKSSHLERSQLEVTVLESWKSPTTGATYPSRWRMIIPSLNLDLDIISRLADQEMKTKQTTGVTYWEGSVGIAGRSGNVRVGGGGYVELTGYADIFKAPL